jgi:membrane associated rhomboid family serine protease
MFPIGDEDVRGAGFPWVTVVLIGLNVLVFGYELTLAPGQLDQFFRTYGVVPAEVLQGRNLISLLTSMFMHGGWAHIFSNMLFLWIFGDNVEATLGKVPYLLFYLCGGLIGSAAYVLLNAGGSTPSLGASGAVAAILGAYVVMFPTARVRVLVIWGFFARVTRVVALIFIGIWFITQLFVGVASLGAATAQTGGIAYSAHIGGFLLGLGVGFLGRSRAKLVRESRERP